MSPIARPVASSSSVAPGTGEQASARSGATTVRHSLSLETSPGRSTAAQVDAVRAELTYREQAILRDLANLRLACTRQLERLHFTSSTPLSNARTCRRVLAKLTALRLIARLDRRVGGVRRGSAGYVYALDTLGQRLTDHGGPASGTVRRPWTPGVAFVRHRLAITESFVALTEAQRRGSLELVAFVAEPGCWRRYSGPGGGALTLKPDAYAVVASGEYEHAWFVEVDCSTESPSTLARKCSAYRSYWASGREQARSGVFPLVVFLVPSDRRARAVRQVIAALPTGQERLFRVGLQQDTVALLAGGTA